MDDLKINYTSGAKKELETLIDDIKKRIEDSVSKISMLLVILVLK